MRKLFTGYFAEVITRGKSYSMRVYMTIKYFQWAVGMCLAGLSLATTLAASESWTLVAQGEPAAIIVLPSKRPGELERDDRNLAAARLLIDHLREMSGAELAIRRENELTAVSVEAGHLVSANGPSTYLLVGEGDLTAKLGVSGQELGPGGILVRTLGNAVVLIGDASPSDPRGASYAAIALLEALGCRYLWPGELGKVVPKRATITVGPMDLCFTPPIGQRKIRWWLTRSNLSTQVAQGLESLQLEPDLWQKQAQASITTPSSCDWRLWHGLGGNLELAGGHSGAGTRYAPDWRAMLDAHPEWFAQQADGTRSYCERYRLCKSNPELIEWVAQSIIAYIGTHPGVKSVSLSPNDGGYASFCMCEACKRLDPPEAPLVDLLVFTKQGKSARTSIRYPSLTDRMLWYWNQVAERVVKVHPDFRFGIDAYGAFTTPPVREHPHPNLVVRYVSSDKEGWMRWREQGIQGIYWRPNLFWGLGATSGRIHLITTSIADFYSFAAANGTLATDVDSILDHWALQGLDYYAAARLNWNPGRTRDSIVDDYCQAGFGAGALSIGRYFRLAEALSNKLLSTDEELATLRGYLNSAAQATEADSVIQARLAFLRTGFNFHYLHTVLHRMVAAAKAKEHYDRVRANRLLNLNYVMMRDLAQHHTLTVNTPFLMHRTAGLASLAPIGGRDFQSAPEVLKAAEGCSLTGYENSLDKLLATYNIPVDGAAPAAKRKEKQKRVEADEKGRAL